jgi:hypothetical protein
MFGPRKRFRALKPPPGGAGARPQFLAAFSIGRRGIALAFVAAFENFLETT